MKYLITNTYFRNSKSVGKNEQSGRKKEQGRGRLEFLCLPQCLCLLQFNIISILSNYLWGILLSPNSNRYSSLSCNAAADFRQCVAPAAASQTVPPCRVMLRRGGRATPGLATTGELFCWDATSRRLHPNAIYHLSCGVRSGTNGVCGPFGTSSSSLSSLGRIKRKPRQHL